MVDEGFAEGVRGKLGDLGKMNRCIVLVRCSAFAVSV